MSPTLWRAGRRHLECSLCAIAEVPGESDEHLAGNPFQCARADLQVRMEGQPIKVAVLWSSYFCSANSR